LQWVTTTHFEMLSIRLFSPSHSRRNNLQMNYLTNQLTTWSRALLQKLTVIHLVKKFPVFYGNRSVITVFTRIRHWNLSWARLIQSTTSHFTSLRFILYYPPICTQVSQVASSLQLFQPQFRMDFSSLPCVLYSPPISLLILIPTVEILLQRTHSIYCVYLWFLPEGFVS